MSVSESSEWMTAAEALEALEQRLGNYSARLRICERAFAGLIRARAEHFQTQRSFQENVDVPKEFWWAKGHEALEQDWLSGDFVTWINKEHEVKAFGVTFAKADVYKLLGPPAKTKPVATRADSTPVVTQAANNKIFLVHGHDHGARDSVALFLQSLSLQPIVLDEQPNKGRTIIEKFEAHSDVGYAVVLMTPDDEGYSRRAKEADPSLKASSRARQNAILEMGYFMARLTRARVCGLTKGEIETPSDLSGVLVVSLDHADWKNRLAKELDDAGYAIDWKGAGVVRTT